MNHYIDGYLLYMISYMANHYICFICRQYSAVPTGSCSFTTGGGGIKGGCNEQSMTNMHVVSMKFFTKN